MGITTVDIWGAFENQLLCLAPPVLRVHQLQQIVPLRRCSELDSRIEPVNLAVVRLGKTFSRSRAQGKNPIKIGST